MKKFDITFKKFNKTKLPKKKIGSHFDLSTSATMEFEILAKSKWSHQHYPMKSACRNKNKAEFEMMRTVDIMQNSGGMNMISTVGFFSLSYPFFQRKLEKKKRKK